MKRCAALAGAVLALACVTTVFATAAEVDAAGPGRALYLEGVSGVAPLVARRAGGLTIRGREAACVNCHRRSGYGGSEGRSYIPPIDAGSLFAARPPGTGASAAGTGRPAYTAETLARAIRAGVDPSGRPLDYLMPRYELTDAAMGALIAYLRGLAIAPSADPTSPLDFATVVAPGMRPERSAAMIDVLHACFDEHNAGPAPQRGRKRLAPEMSMRPHREWRLHVWELQGEPQTWRTQLSDHVRREPVFAMVGGIGGGTWAPVHEFCEANGLPCIFPHVEAPVAGQAGFYALYLNRGVLLEAAIIARAVTNEARRAQHVLQVVRADDAAAVAGAAALRHTLAARGVDVAEQRIEAAAPLDAQSISATAADALVLWLRGDDFTRMQALPAKAAQVFLSATLADPERSPLPAAWKSRALVAYPYELPQNRRQAMTRFHTWLDSRGIALVDEPVQADAYTACAALQIGMNELADRVHPDYLVERLEVIIELGGYTGLYPRFTLGIGQRFASKTGYLVRYENSDSTQMIAVGERIAP